MRRVMTVVMATAIAAVGTPQTHAQTYTIVDTGQIRCYGDHTEIGYPKPGDVFFGQDAHYQGNQPAYHDNGDGTVTDLNTGLMWQADPGKKKTYAQAVAGAKKCRTGKHKDWRLPTIKELYSIIQYSGADPDPMSRDSSMQKPFIDTAHFGFRYGKSQEGERIIDSQWATSTLYVGKVMRNQQAMFGVYIAFGRALGFMSPPGRRRSKGRLMDVHGAGAQRADAKSGDPSTFPQGRGPQGDVMRVFNLARCVRGGTAEPHATGPNVEMEYVRQEPKRPDSPPGGQDGPPRGGRGNRPASGADWVRRLDRNRDDKVSRQEFDGPAEHFVLFDRNRDGGISADEAPTGPPPPRNRRPPRPSRPRR